MHIWTSWYPIKDAQHLEECLRAIRLNLENPYVAKVTLLCETPFPDTHEKLECISIDTRPSYGTFFRRFDAKNVHILVNTDIVLGWQPIVPKPNHCYALARYNVISDIRAPINAWSVRDMGILSAYSQDTWALYQPQFSNLVVFDSILMGVPGCDNRVAYELHMQGIKVTNPSKTIRTYHLHKNEERSYTDSYHDRNYKGLAISATHLPGRGYSIVHRQWYYITDNIPSGESKNYTWRVMR